MKKPVIIDCDPGIDDAVALFIAFAADNLDIRAITTVAGNVGIEKTTNNALKLVEYIGKSVRVARGASRPIMKEPVTAEEVHGSSGLGNMVIPEAKGSTYYKNAYDTIYEEAINYKGELQIIALGPLTNIALTLMKYPDIRKKISNITLMGGSIGLGNCTPSAEFNIYADPEAAKVVFGSGIDITMVGLDATHKALAFEEDIREILSLNNGPSEFTGKCMLSYLEFYRRHGFKGAALHDPSAVAAVIDESLLKTQYLYVNVETKGEFTSGKTVVDIYRVTGKKPNVHVAVDIDRDRFINLVKELLKKYGK
jgi:pyrimidine-specific ribonucleoside hydrolase